MNFEKINTFEGGYSKDLTDNSEKKNTFEKGLNGRLYSRNNTISFTAIEGSKLIYNNNQIVKYLGYYSFRDELIVFCKVLKPVGEVGEVGGTITVTETNLVGTNDFTSALGSASPVSLLETFVSDNVSEVTNSYDVIVSEPEDVDLDGIGINYDCNNLDTGLTIDLGEYYSVHNNVPVFKACSLSGAVGIPENNGDYYDAIFSLKLNESNDLVGTLLWRGLQNWPFNGKISTEGVEENEFFKRVYYTDALNVRRVVNIKDTSLSTRLGSEFNQVLNSVLLQPTITEVVNGGELKAMSVAYMYRIISENGQVSQFSPTSFVVKILDDSEAIGYRGGDISESVSKSVNLKVNPINVPENGEIECVAVEFETSGVPTSIRNLGKKSIANTVYFTHVGNEDEFSDDITLDDLLEFKNTWKYCNDFSSKKNKLIAAGLRNDPEPSEFNNLEYLFWLRAYNESLESHDCIINPDPTTYNLIAPLETDSWFYINKKAYNTLSVFGPTTITLLNTETDASVDIQFPSLSLNEYTNLKVLVFDWLEAESLLAGFDTSFPNLDFSYVNDKLVFKPIDDLVETDMSNYVLQSSNAQFINNFDSEVELNVTSPTSTNMVRGYESLGFRNGTGARITFREYKYPLLNQATAVYDGTDKLLDYFAPNGELNAMKGEIYRLGVQFFDLDSTPFFNLPLGDIQIPKVGDIKSEIDDNGNIIIYSTEDSYSHQSVEDGVLYGYGIKLHMEFRIPCELQDKVSMYQITYVERTEENRTILCQGIAQPMTRLRLSTDVLTMRADIKNNWTLEYSGGPTYDKVGLRQYDNGNENSQVTTNEGGERVITSRSLFSFDSPDILYGKLSGVNIENFNTEVIGGLNTDHTSEVIREHGGDLGTYTYLAPDGEGGFDTVTVVGNEGDEVYPKFSRKILEDQLENMPLSGLPRRTSGSSFENYFVNVSVFSDFIKRQSSHNIKHAEVYNPGEINSGSPFGLINNISNNTFSLCNPSWYYGWFQRNWTRNSGDIRSSAFENTKSNKGIKTVILKTEDDMLTDTLIGDTRVCFANSQIRLGVGFTIYDRIPLVNITKGNEASVYGGRTKQAFTANKFIPISNTIPVLKGNTSVQVFDIGIDTYVTLNVLSKTLDGGIDNAQTDIRNTYTGGSSDIIFEVQLKDSFYTYACVLESTVEPKETYQYEFYRQLNDINFYEAKPDLINEAYFQLNNLKEYVSKPFTFKDDPNQNNVIAVSDVKLSGEEYDSWTVFKTNNFYAELEKNKGDVSNLVKDKDNVYAIQEQQTSLIYIGVDRIVNDADGEPINVQQGSGTVVEGHQVVSNFGTSIRRSTTESDDYGFTFFDEKKNEFVKMGKPLLQPNMLHLYYDEIFKTNPVIDVETYFDQVKKETNVCLKLKDGQAFILSYSEVFGKFNGEYQMTSDLFMMFDEKVYAPIRVVAGEDNLSENLHQLNEGNILNLFNEQKELVLGFIVNVDVNKVMQYKSIGVISEIDYPLKNIFFKSNLGYDRNIEGIHNWYKIREGIHTVPAINESNDFYNNEDVRGAWVYVEITAESLNNNKVNILAVINSLRVSHQ